MVQTIIINNNYCCAMHNYFELLKAAIQGASNYVERPLDIQCRALLIFFSYKDFCKNYEKPICGSISDYVALKFHFLGDNDNYYD